MAVVEIPEATVWASFPEAKQNEILGLLGMLLERLAAAGGASEVVGGERGSAV